MYPCPKSNSPVLSLSPYLFYHEQSAVIVSLTTECKIESRCSYFCSIKAKSRRKYYFLYFTQIELK